LAGNDAIEGPFVIDLKENVFFCIFKNDIFKLKKMVKVISNLFITYNLKRIFTFIILNIHC